MKVVASILVALLIFVFAWIFNATLIVSLAYAAAAAGLNSKIFIFLNIFIAWILAPGLGSGIAIYSTSKRFKTVDTNIIFVGFISVVTVLLVLMFASSIFVYSQNENNTGDIIILAAQSASVFIGAKIGRSILRKETG